MTQYSRPYGKASDCVGGPHLSVSCHVFDLKTSEVHMSVDRDAVAKSGKCTARRRDVLYNVLALGSMVKD